MALAWTVFGMRVTTAAVGAVGKVIFPSISLGMIASNGEGFVWRLQSQQGLSVVGFCLVVVVGACTWGKQGSVRHRDGPRDFSGG